MKRSSLALLPGAFALLGLLAATPGLAEKAGVQKVSTQKDRKEVAVTVYNDGFGLVREVRDLDLAQGRVALELRDVAARIQPETVSIKTLAGTPGAKLDVLEQNYRYDLLNPQKLLEKYVGKKVKIYRWNDKTGKDDAVDAEVLAVGSGSPVLKINGEITYGYPGRFAFPEVPANLIAKPTLVWLLDSSAPKQKVEVTYLTSGFSWKADYVLVLDDSDARADLQGWVTLNNQSGASYESAKLKLVAGDVQKLANVQEELDDEVTEGKKDAAKPGVGKKGFVEEGLFEYHLYTLQKPTDLLQNEQKQVSLLEGQGIAVRKKLVFPGASWWYRGTYGQVTTNQKVSVFLEVENKEQNHLGMPLPKGIVRVYKADKSGSKQFVGEDRIDHTPRDEKVQIKMGEAFDVVGDRKQMSWKPWGKCGSESEWEISLRNHKDAVETVELVEPTGGDWEILSSSHPTVKQDAHTFTITVAVPKQGEVKVKYRLRTRWC